MGRKVLFAAVCWLSLSQTFGDVRFISSAVPDNEGAESAPRLYRNVPFAVYASAAPYGAYSFQLPTFATAPKAAASRVIPVTENFVNHLTDSYGNRFVGTPQLSPYKIAFPQQYVPVPSKLPEHLAQPLVAASANFQFKQSNGQFFGAPYRIPASQGPVPTPLHHFPNFGQLYGDNVKNLAPSAVTHKQVFGFPNTQQQSTNNKAVFSNTQSHGNYNHFKNAPQKESSQIIVGNGKVQGIQEIPSQPHSETKFQRIQEAPPPHRNEAKQEQHEEKHQQLPELPRYETKFQIIEEQSHSPQTHKIIEHYAPHEEVKYQRAQESPATAQKQHADHSHSKVQQSRQGDKKSSSQSNKAKLQTAPGKQKVTYINDINGEKTIVEIETKPNLPLLDLTLLEPLTFDNPLVPQVQHFLPRINQATYKKLPQANIPSVKNYQKDYVVEKTTSYDSGEVHDKQHKDGAKKKQKKPTQQNKYPKKNDVPKKTTVTYDHSPKIYHDTLEDAPEIVYEITAPNYKETVKEKAISYNKQTQSEPISYTYGTKSEKDPVTYSFSRTSKEPVQIMSIQYHGTGPRHLVYNFKPEEHVHEEKSSQPPPQHHDDKHSSHESDDDGHHNHQYTEHHHENPQSAEEYHEPSHKEQDDSHHQPKDTYYNENEGKQQQVVHDDTPPKYYSEPAQIVSEHINFQPILQEYENNIRILSTPSASIKVDPHQHVQKSTPQPQTNHHETTPQSHTQHQHPHSSPAPQVYSHPTPEPQKHHHHSAPQSQTYNTPAPHIHEKSKRVLIHEETPDEMHMLREQMQQEVTNHEENSEEDFEKAYHDAAFGFPAYNQKSSDSEKDIFDPESYGVPHDHLQYDFENTPFQQYQEEGDEFPKESRSSYKDARDKMMQNYYSDYSISKPESLLDRYQNKLGYYKLYKQQKPDYVIVSGNGNKQNQKLAKYTVAPSFSFHAPRETDKTYYGHAKPKQQLYEHDYSNGAPRDSSAFASRPYQNYKRRTSFVEPQFQYGFEPISIPKLLDSELAAMASNDSPESEKPGMRKKIYKENWYIKKTSTSAGAPAS